MPMYCYRCEPCGKTHDALRRIDDRNDPFACPDCGQQTERVIHQSSTYNWNPEWRFEHLSEHGDGSRTFRTEREYRQHLKDNNWGEVGPGAGWV